MSFENAKKYLEKAGFGDRIHDFSESSATVALAAKALGCEEKQIAKTLSFQVDDAPILIVAAGNVKIDNPKYKAQFSQKAKMIPAPMLDELIGHGAGGVCPFGVKPGVTVYLDESLKENEIVYPAAGNGNSAVRLSIGELEACSGYETWVDVCKKME